MPKGKPRRTVQKAVREAVASKLGNTPELIAIIKELVLSVKEVYAQNRVLISKIHNLTVDLGTEKVTNLKLLNTLAELMDEHSQQEVPAYNIIKDFLRTKTAQTVRSPNDSR